MTPAPASAVFKKILSAHRNIHLKLIYPSKRGNLCIDCPEAVPGMLHQFF
jgi:hypothetical protein